MAQDALVQTTGLIDRPADRSRVASEQSAAFVDMESASLALHAVERGIPWAALRIVSDSPEHPLTFLAELLGGLPTEQPSFRRVGPALARRPWHLGRLMRLALSLHAGRGAVGRVVLASRSEGAPPAAP